MVLFTAPNVALEGAALADTPAAANIASALKARSWPSLFIVWASSEKPPVGYCNRLDHTSHLPEHAAQQ
jgi:hypothetical protein